MDKLLQEIRNCTHCEAHLPAGCRPVLSASPKSKILVVGQAPGRVVHRTGIPWNDKSGENLRAWMNVDKDAFYNTDYFGIVPMGFCYPGTGKSGDLPPRKECAPLWHEALLEQMPDIRLILLIGQYAQRYYLADKNKRNLTQRVQHYKEYLPMYLPLPHPSPRNNIWQKKNAWFKELVIPELRTIVQDVLVG